MTKKGSKSFHLGGWKHHMFDLTLAEMIMKIVGD